VVERFQLDGQGRVLDLGCGTGQLTLPLARHCEEIVGTDPEPEMLAEPTAQAAAYSTLCVDLLPSVYRSRHRL
jgi:ubiquinone/menaquinone biosynthesis C-methylase UbiE